MTTNHIPMTREAFRDEMERSRRQTSDDLAILVTDYLEQATESLRRALARSSDISLGPEHRLPEDLKLQIVNLGLALRSELRRRGR